MKNIILFFLNLGLFTLLYSDSLTVFQADQVDIKTTIFENPIILSVNNLELNGNERPAWIDLLVQSFSVPNMTYEEWLDLYTERCAHSLNLSKDRFHRVKAVYEEHGRVESYLYCVYVEYNGHKYAYVAKVNGRVEGVFEENFEQKHTLKSLYYDKSKRKWLLDDAPKIH